MKVNNLKYSNMSILDYLAYSETVNNINVLPPRVYALDSYIESLDRGVILCSKMCEICSCHIIREK